MKARILAAALALASAGPAFATYTPVDISSYVNGNVSIRPDTFPIGTSTGNQGSGVVFKTSPNPGNPSVMGTWLAPGPNSSLVVDLSGLTLETVQLAAGAFILRKIYREMFRWGQADRLRLAVVLDEAHRLAKDVTLPKLMKEGRKYGVSVVAASQGISDFHKDVLGNAGAKIIFRTNYPESRTTAGFLRGSDGQDLSQQLEQLGVGTAYVSVPDHVRARKVYMSPD